MASLFRLFSVAVISPKLYKISSSTAFITGLFWLILSSLTTPVSGQSTYGEFGQNRVQYKDFVWSFYDAEHFNIYFYQGGQDLAKFTLLAAEKNYEDIGEDLDFTMTEKIDIMVYTDLSDLNQTNIGINESENNIGGTTKIVANKLFVYFNGDHSHLEAQIRTGIARIYVDKMLFGVNFQEMLQNAVLLNLPTWFTEGLVQYIGQGWSSEHEDRLRDGILSGKYQKLHKLDPDEAAFVGHALWQYISSEYGETAVPNLIYLTRINRNIESGFLFVLGGSVNQTLENWYVSNKKKFDEEEKTRSSVENKFETPNSYKKKYDYFQPVVHPDGNQFIYVTNDLGRYKVWLYNVRDEKRELIMKGGFKAQSQATDLSYPIIDIDPTGRKAAVIYDKKDQIKLLVYDIKSGEKKHYDINKFQRIFGVTFGSNHKTLILSAMQKGQCDLFTYHIPSSKVIQITNDYHDDLQPKYIKSNGRTGILFSSNRYSDTIRKERIDTTLTGSSYDIFFYRLDQPKEFLTRVTNTPLANESHPSVYSNGYYSYLSDETGIRNVYRGFFKEVFWYNKHVQYFIEDESGVMDSITYYEGQILDSLLDLSTVTLKNLEVRPVNKDIGVNQPLTNYAQNVVDLSTSPRHRLLSFRDEGLLKFYIVPFDTTETLSMSNVKRTDYMEAQWNAYEELNKEDEVIPSLESETTIEFPLFQEEDTTEGPGYFQSDFDFMGDLYLPDSLTIVDLTNNVPRKLPFKYPRIRNYFLKFTTDKLVTQFDNHLIATRYQKFNPQTPIFDNPGLGGLFKLGVTDVMENHKVVGGFRFPTNFSSSEYFVTYINLKKRIDKTFTFYRKSTTDQSEDIIPFYNIPISAGKAPVRYRIRTNYLEAKYKYPLDVLQRVDLGIGFRNDQYVFVADNDSALVLPSYGENWLIARTEYVYDHTIQKGLNLKDGFQFKAFFEFQKQIPTRKDTIIGNLEGPIPQLNDAYIASVGLDLRYFQPIHRQITWANRFSFGASMGTRNLIYYLGGVNGWIGATFDESTPISTDQNYAYQTLATDVRGFDQNIRNGNKFAILNTEVRIPVFAYFINNYIKSQFIRNFQVVGFADAGSAWEGVNPFAKDNPLFSDVIRDPENSPVSVTINYFRSPIVLGYGFGFRSVLFGYFIKTDIAWGLDSGEVSPRPKWYFSLGKDF